MEICIVTKDDILARFLILELAEAGFAALQCDEPGERASLIICDLDSYGGSLPENAIGFSYSETNRRRVQSFLHRPISIEALKAAVKERLEIKTDEKEVRFLALDTTTRKVRSSSGEVRLSEKELALLKELLNTPLLTREDAAGIFGDGDSNVVDVYMHYLRRKLKSIYPYDVIESKRGKGYSLCGGVNVELS